MSTAASGIPEVTRAIRELEQTFVLHARAKDAAALTEMFYAEDAQLLAPGVPVLRGKAAIRAFWTEFMKIAGADVTLEAETVEASGDMAYCVGRYDGTIAGARQHGKYVVVFRRQADGGYKAVADAFNADHS